MDPYGVFLLGSNIVLILIAAVCAAPIYKMLPGILGGKRFAKIKMALIPLLFILCIIFMISETYNPFLYFRF